jgi:hypothetical protein
MATDRIAVIKRTILSVFVTITLRFTAMHMCFYGIIQSFYIDIIYETTQIYLTISE